MLRLLVQSIKVYIVVIIGASLFHLWMDYKTNGDYPVNLLIAATVIIWLLATVYFLDLMPKFKSRKEFVNALDTAVRVQR